MFYIYYKDKDMVFQHNEVLNTEEIVCILLRNCIELSDEVLRTDILNGDILFGEDELFYKKMVSENILSNITIVGRSMIPLYIPNDIVEIEEINGNPAIGAVIVFLYNGELIVHRIIKIIDENIVTRGDNCKKEDNPVNRNSVIGIVRKRKTSIIQRLRWATYYLSKGKLKKGIGIILSCF